MSDHLSKLELDEAVLGRAAHGAEVHLERCQACRARLDGARVTRDRFVASSAFESGFERLREAQRARRAHPSWRLGTLLAAAAAAVVLVAVSARPPKHRMKGGAYLTLVDDNGRPVSVPRVGDIVELEFYPGPYHRALVIAVDEAGNEMHIFPLHRAGDETVAPGVELSARFRVTPGALRIVAGFSDSSMETPDLLAAHARADIDLREREVKPAP